MPPFKIEKACRVSSAGLSVFYGRGGLLPLGLREFVV
jgi:hypothetical protein